jgi:hypothetical protein
VDLDYRGCLHGPWLWFTFQWQTGCRIAALEYDNRSSYTDLQENDHITFFGVGPHFGIDLNWYLERTGIGTFGRGDVALEFGHGLEHTTTHFLPTPNTIVVGSSDVASNAYTLDALNVLAECGLSWTPSTQRWLRVECGIRLFFFGTGDRGFTNTGPFLRCEVGF